MIGDIVFLGIIGLTSDALTKYGLETLLKEVYLQKKSDRNELIETFSKLLDKISPQEINSLDNQELTKRIEGVIIVEAMSHLLENFTPEQIEIFEVGVAGK